MSNTENAIFAANNLAKALTHAKIDKFIDLKTMKVIQKIADIVKTNEIATPSRVNKKQQKVFSPASASRVHENILDHAIKKHRMWFHTMEMK